MRAALQQQTLHQRRQRRGGRVCEQHQARFIASAVRVFFNARNPIQRQQGFERRRQLQGVHPHLPRQRRGPQAAPVADARAVQVLQQLNGQLEAPALVP